MNEHEDETEVIVGDNETLTALQIRKKEWRKQHPAYFRQYYRDNCAWVECECGQQVKNFSKRKHTMSKKHGQLLAEKNK